MPKIVPNVKRGGKAISIGNNLYYMRGRKHANGGIDVGDTLEVEGGEVVQTNTNGVKVFSAQPILNGNSPAKLVMSGANPDRVFNAQEDYKDRMGLNDDGSRKRYGGKCIKAMGGLSRSKDYGSKKKPYPNVEGKDFAGGNRSYPIPTKADAIDALRLAGLHGRSDVKAKVYKKYPELKKKVNGGVVSVNGNVIDRLVRPATHTSPTGGRQKAALGTGERDKNYVVWNGRLYQVITDEFGETGYVDVNDIPNHRLLTNADYDRKHARKIPKDVKAAAARDAKTAAANSPVVRGYNFIEPKQFVPTPIERRAVSKPKQTNTTTVKPKASATNYDYRVGDRLNNSQYYNIGDEFDYNGQKYKVTGKNKAIPVSGGQTKQKDADVRNAAIRDSKGARTDFRDMLEPDVYNPITTNRQSKASAPATQTRVTPVETKTVTNATNNVVSNVTNATPRRESVRRAPTTPAVARTTPNFPTLDSTMQGLPTIDTNLNLPTRLESPVQAVADTQSATGDTKRRRRGLFKNVSLEDITGLGSNLAATIASRINTRNALRRMQAPSKPRYETPVAMKTRFNIAPQISQINEDTRRAMEDITGNTSSSRVALQRRQRARNVGQYSKNTLYGQKENIETQLINQDRLNRQQVGARNVAMYNDWRNRVTQFNNAVREQQASSLNNMFSGINSSIQDMLSRIENRRNYNNTLGIYDATHPNVDRRLFTSKGVTF